MTGTAASPAQVASRWTSRYDGEDAGGRPLKQCRSSMVAPNRRAAVAMHACSSVPRVRGRTQGT